MALNISFNIVASEKGRELVQHGSALFPIACYAEDLSSYSVAWHWHEEFEDVLCTKGPLHVDVNKTRLTLQTGQGVFINSGVLHAVEQAPEGTALLHSGVFHRVEDPRVNKDALPGLQGQAGLVHVHMEGAFHAEHIFKFLVPVPRHRVAGQIFGVAGDGKQRAAVLHKFPALFAGDDVAADI